MKKLLFILVIAIMFVACEKDPIVVNSNVYPFFVSKVVIERIDSIPNDWVVELTRSCGNESKSTYSFSSYVVDIHHAVSWSICDGCDTLQYKVELTNWSDKSQHIYLGHVTMQRGDTSLHYLPTLY